MEYVNRSGKADGVDRPEGVAIEVVDYLEDGTAAEPLSALAESGSPPR